MTTTPVPTERPSASVSPKVDITVTTLLASRVATNKINESALSVPSDETTTGAEVTCVTVSAEFASLKLVSRSTNAPTIPPIKPNKEAKTASPKIARPRLRPEELS